MSKFNVRLLTLFPEMFPGMLGQSLAGKALEKGLWTLETKNIRDYATDVHKTVDDTPFGGGAGMVMKPDVLDRVIQDSQPLGRFIYMSPRGTPLTQPLVKALSQETQITILCGRYEGVDQRLLEAWNAEEISIGDYVLSGGEPAATILIDACVRLLPGAIGNSETHSEESFENDLLEYPHYTRPAVWTDANGQQRAVPEVLLSGHHAKINDWRRAESEKITRARRPDLWQKYQAKSKETK